MRQAALDLRTSERIVLATFSQISKWLLLLLSANAYQGLHTEIAGYLWKTACTEPLQHSKSRADSLLAEGNSLTATVKWSACCRSPCTSLHADLTVSTESSALVHILRSNTSLAKVFRLLRVHASLIDKAPALHHEHIAVPSLRSNFWVNGT